MSQHTFHIDIVSDVVCPWCIIGYKQLQKALQATPEVGDMDIRWHPFQLNPHMPPEGQNLREHLMMKYGSTAEQSIAARQRLTDLGESLGFSFDYFDDMRMVNTFDAHRLLHWAGLKGRQTEMKLALFTAFFSHRKDVSNAKVLAATAAEAGLPEDEASLVLEQGTFSDEVNAELEHWLDQGIHAVPTFIFNNKYQVPGAQDAETFVRVLRKINEKESVA